MATSYCDQKSILPVSAGLLYLVAQISWVMYTDMNKRSYETGSYFRYYSSHSRSCHGGLLLLTKREAVPFSAVCVTFAVTMTTSIPG